MRFSMISKEMSPYPPVKHARDLITRCKTSDSIS
jgi:hypothetical protein